MATFAEQRAGMVERQLRRRGIADERVLAAMAEVPREQFVPTRLRGSAYSDGALPIGHEQTISQPWIVAAICAALELGGDERVLEIGTGSGYSTAVLARLAASVTSVERHAELARAAAGVLLALGVHNVRLLVGDGSRGPEDGERFEAIAVHATAPAPPPGLLAALAEGGRLVLPLARDGDDELIQLRRRGDEFERSSLGPCRFVPLIGEGGY